MRECILEAWESGNRKTFQYIALFCFLVVIYSLYLATLLRVIHLGSEPGSLFGPLAMKLSFISAVPFAVLAYSERNWSSNDAAPVCLAAWIAVCIGFSFRCVVCALGLTTVFFPFIFSALLAHGFGTVCRFAKDRVHPQ
jgi:presenilin-like A22 family membrane protease